MSSLFWNVSASTDFDMNNNKKQSKNQNRINFYFTCQTRKSNQGSDSVNRLFHSHFAVLVMNIKDGINVSPIRARPWLWLSIMMSYQHKESHYGDKTVARSDPTPACSTTLFSGTCPKIAAGSGSSWWRHQMETFSALLALCTGNSPVTGEFPAQRPVTRSFDVFFDLHRNKRLNKQSRRWCFETPSRSLWRHCNGGDVM